MLRRRRHRSAFSRRAPPWVRPAAIGGAAIAAIALFVFFIRQADVLAPEPEEVRVELPDAFGE